MTSAQCQSFFDLETELVLAVDISIPASFNAATLTPSAILPHWFANCNRCRRDWGIIRRTKYIQATASRTTCPLPQASGRSTVTQSSPLDFSNIDILSSWLAFSISRLSSIVLAQASGIIRPHHFQKIESPLRDRAE